MDYFELVNQIFEVCIIPLLGVLTTFIITLLKKKAEEISVSTDNETMKKYINMLTTTITDCVIATNQTYVDALKEQGKFDAEAQKIAFNLTYTSVMEILNDDAKIYLTNIFGDLEEYIKKKIETEVYSNKGGNC